MVPADGGVPPLIGHSWVPARSRPQGGGRGPYAVPRALPARPETGLRAGASGSLSPSLPAPRRRALVLPVLLVPCSTSPGAPPPARARPTAPGPAGRDAGGARPETACPADPPPDGHPDQGAGQHDRRVASRPAPRGGGPVRPAAVAVGCGPPRRRPAGSGRAAGSGGPAGRVTFAGTLAGRLAGARRRRGDPGAGRLARLPAALSPLATRARAESG